MRAALFNNSNPRRAGAAVRHTELLAVSGSVIGRTVAVTGFTVAVAVPGVIRRGFFFSVHRSILFLSGVVAARGLVLVSHAGPPCCVLFTKTEPHCDHGIAATFPAHAT